jgi:hypothetical protein
MRFEEFSNGIQIPINNEEIRIIDSIKKSITGGLDARNLSDGDCELARKMVSRGLLNRKKINGDTHYFVNNRRA